MISGLNRLRVLLVFLFGGFAFPAFSQGTNAVWPARPIQVVSPFAPGGSDIPLRIYASMLGERLKWNIIVDYKPGANGAIAAGSVAKAAPDGYTLFVSSNSLAVTEILEHPVPYDGVKDFSPVYQMTKTQQVLVVMRRCLPGPWRNTWPMSGSVRDKSTSAWSA